MPILQINVRNDAMSLPPAPMPRERFRPCPQLGHRCPKTRCALNERPLLSLRRSRCLDRSRCCICEPSFQSTSGMGSTRSSESFCRMTGVVRRAVIEQRRSAGLGVNDRLHQEQTPMKNRRMTRSRTNLPLEFGMRTAALCTSRQRLKAARADSEPTLTLGKSPRQTLSLSDGSVSGFGAKHVE